MKSVSDCFNVFDDAMVEDIGKRIGISILENFHKNLIAKGQSELIEIRVALSIVLRQTISIIENHHQFVEEDMKSVLNS